jgi:hypothetical protein
LEVTLSNFKELSGIADSEEGDDRSEDIYLSDIGAIKENKMKALMDVTGKRNYYSLVSLFLFILFLSSYQIYLNESDDVAVSYSLPELRNMDAPVLLEEISGGTDSDSDHIMKGFVRQYLRARYPKNSKEARMMYSFVARTSKGNIRKDFLSRLSDMSEISRKLDSGGTTTIYPKSSDNIKIRKNSTLGNWIVEFDGRYVSDIGVNDSSRAYVKVNMEITHGSGSIKNSPSGLYVVVYHVTYMKDGVTNEINEIDI